MDAVEDFESRPHKAVTFLVDRDKELQELRKLKMPEVWRKMENEVIRFWR